MSGLKRVRQQAVRLTKAGRHAEAIPVWEAIFRQQPASSDNALALGAELLACDRLADASQLLAKSSRDHPDNPDIALLYGRVLVRQGLRQYALGAFFHALSLSPDSVEAHANIASALYRERKSDAALLHAEFACQHDPSNANIATYLLVLQDLRHLKEGIAFVDRLMAAYPARRPSLLTLRAVALNSLGRISEALENASEAARLAPDSPYTQFICATTLLAQGYLTPAAWAGYEGRSGLLESRAWPARELRWTNQDLNGRTIVIHAEQGLGDTLQFVRYVPLVADLGARVILAVQPALVSLLQGLPGATEVIPIGKLPEFDYYCPLLSLPGQLKTTLETIPPPLQYAIDLPQASSSKRLQVGIVWAGNDEFIDDRRRSLDPALLASLAELSEIDYHSLQYSAKTLPFSGMQSALVDVVDFADTARRIAKLDLVISVDTAVAHLSATMGKPVWLLNRQNGCWRWLLDREDTPWYPSVRLFRQAQPEEWASVIDRIRIELMTLTTDRRNATSLTV
ncbi:MAG: hypothetical protein EOO77_13785 [Oxalobacteraceae bacterium]|nr:MAG: hypothetical protein EOO77_13785 [Oxalobacteraceae bacterium]